MQKRSVSPSESSGESVWHARYGPGSTSTLRAKSDSGSLVTAPASASQAPRKRKRRVVSCEACHRRKQKCDRNQPCKACVKRGMEKACRYETLAMSRERHTIRVFEATGRECMPQADNTAPAKAAEHDGYMSTMVMNTFGVLEKLNDSGNEIHDAHIDPHLANLDLQETQHGHEEHRPNEQMSRHSFMWNTCRRATDQTQSSVTSSAGPDANSAEYAAADRYRAMVRDLPARPAVDRLVAIYFRECNWMEFVLDEDVFLKQLYDWRVIAENPFVPLHLSNVESADLRAFPALLFQVLATAILSLEPEVEDDQMFFESIKIRHNGKEDMADTMEALALQYSERGMSLLVLLGKQQVSLTTVLAGFLRTAFFKYSATITESWHSLGNAIRDGQKIGLHSQNQDPQPPAAATPEAVLLNQWNIQQRRRLWMTMVIWDLTMALILGQPTTVDINTSLTMPVDCVIPASYEERMRMPVQVRGPSDPPTALTRALWAYHAIEPRRAVFGLQVQGNTPHDFPQVDVLHEQLVAIEESMPAYLRLENADKHLDDLPGLSWLPMYRMIASQITVFNFMTLHRPYIFMRAKSRTEALKACLRMLSLQRMQFSLLRRKHYHSSNLFCTTFDALVLMASIYILFPKEHPELLPEVIQNLRWPLERYEDITSFSSMARSALPVMHTLYQRMRKTLGVQFVESEGGIPLGGPTATAAGSAPVDALTLSNIDPSLKGPDTGPVLVPTDVPTTAVASQDTHAGPTTKVTFTDTQTSGPALSMGGIDVLGSGLLSWDGSSAPLLAGTNDKAVNLEELAPLSGQQPQIPLDPALVTPQDQDVTGAAPADESLFPADFDWTTLQPIFPTGDLANNILMGVGEGSTGWAGGLSGEAVATTVVAAEGEVVPSLFEGDFGNNSLWGLLNNRTPL